MNGKAQNEHMFSGVPRIADVRQPQRRGCFGPKTDIKGGVSAAAGPPDLCRIAVLAAELRLVPRASESGIITKADSGHIEA